MHRSPWKLLLTAALGAGFASQACSGEVIEGTGGTTGTTGITGTGGAAPPDGSGSAGAGVAVSNTSYACMEKGVVTAVGLATNVPRFMIFKADSARDVCLRLMVEGFDGPGIGIMTSTGWSVGSAEITDHASDCTLSNGYPAPPVGSSAQATGATGSLTIDGPLLPCKITIHATVSFNPPGMSSEPIDAEHLEVTGGCG